MSHVQHCSIPCLKSVLCIYQLKKVTKNILAIVNHLKWTNQNHIKQWTNLFDDIQIKLTLKYLSLEDKPLFLSTNPLVSRIKNFKVKLIADDLPTHLTLYDRNPQKHPYYTCPRCYAVPKDTAHLLTCIRNVSTLESQLKDITIV